MRQIDVEPRLLTRLQGQRQPDVVPLGVGGVGLGSEPRQYVVVLDGAGPARHRFQAEQFGAQATAAGVVRQHDGDPVGSGGKQDPGILPVDGARFAVVHAHPHRLDHAPQVQRRRGGRPDLAAVGDGDADPGAAPAAEPADGRGQARPVAVHRPQRRHVRHAPDRPQRAEPTQRAEPEGGQPRVVEVRVPPDLHDGLDADPAARFPDVDPLCRAEPGDRGMHPAADRQVDDVRRADEQQFVNSRQIGGGSVGPAPPVHTECLQRGRQLMHTGPLLVGLGHPPPHVPNVDGLRRTRPGRRVGQAHRSVALRRPQSYGVPRRQRDKGQPLDRHPLGHADRRSRDLDPVAAEDDGERHLGGERQHTVRRGHQIRGGQGERPVMAPGPQRHVRQHQRARVRGDGDRYAVHDRRARCRTCRAEMRYGDELPASVEVPSRR